MKKQPLYLLVVLPVVVCFALILIISALSGDWSSGSNVKDGIPTTSIPYDTTPYVGDPNDPLTNITSSQDTTAPDILFLTPEDSSGWLYFEKQGDGTYAVRLKNSVVPYKYLHINIPETFDGIAVTHILPNGFSSDKISRVTLPNTIKTIGASAFENCTDLTMINLPEGLESIDILAFSGCVNLQHIELPSTIKTVKASTFKDCRSLLSVSLGKEVEQIGKLSENSCVDRS